MDAATEHVRALAGRVVGAALELGPLRAASSKGGRCTARSCLAAGATG